MNKYTCEGMRPVLAESFTEAAQVFAARMARKNYGKKSNVGALRLDSHPPDHSYAIFDAFIGYRSGLNETTGHNVSLHVYRKD
jgi:hypothetical protein